MARPKRPPQKVFHVKLPQSEAIAFERLLERSGKNPNRWLRETIAAAANNPSSEKSPSIAG